MALQLGDTAPDFEADTTEGRIRFHEWLGDSWAVLFSHPKDFTPICTTELGYMASIKPEFDRRGVKIIGLSVDPTGRHEEWAKDIEETQGHAPNYPICSATWRASSRSSTGAGSRSSASRSTRPAGTRSGPRTSRRPRATPPTTRSARLHGEHQAGVRPARGQDHRPLGRPDRPARGVGQGHRGDPGPRPQLPDLLGYMASIKPEFDRRGVKIIGLSVDPTGRHEEWAKDIEETQGHAPNYPICSATWRASSRSSTGAGSRSSASRSTRPAGTRSGPRTSRRPRATPPTTR